MASIRRLNFWLGQVFDDTDGANLWAGIENLAGRTARALFSRPVMLKSPYLDNLALNFINVGPWYGFDAAGNPLFQESASLTIPFDEATHGSLLGPVEVLDVGKSRMIFVLARYTLVNSVDVIDANGLPKYEQMHHALAYRVIMSDVDLNPQAPPDLSDEIENGSIPIFSVLRSNIAGVQTNVEVKGDYRFAMYRSLHEQQRAFDLLKHPGTFLTYDMTDKWLVQEAFLANASNLLIEEKTPGNFVVRLYDNDTSEWFGRISHDRMLTCDMREPATHYLETGTIGGGLSYVRLGVDTTRGRYFPTLALDAAAVESVDNIILATVNGGVAPPVIAAFSDRTPDWFSF